MNKQQNVKQLQQNSIVQTECQFVRRLKMLINQNCHKQMNIHKLLNSESQNSSIRTCKIKDLQEQGKIFSNKTENQKPEITQQQYQKTSKVCKENSISKRIHNNFLMEKQKEHLQLIYCSIGLLIMLVLIFHQNNDPKIKSLF